MSATGPILVTGPDRSGTTLLYALLASHPDISMVRRTNMWRWFDRRFGDLAVPANLDRCLDTMARYRRLDVLKPDVERIRAEFRDGAPTYGRLFELFHRQHAIRRGKRRWGDKSLHTEYSADRVLAELPDAKIIQLVRDPRDRYASILRRYEERRKGIGAATGRWLASVREGRRNVDRHRGRYLVVRYETLAREPESTLRAICAFLDARYTPLMLAMHGVPDRDDRSGNSSFGDIQPGTISTRSIGRYRSVLPGADIALIQAWAGRGMATHGYTPDRVPLPNRRKAALYSLDLPLGAVRIAGWLATRKAAELTHRGAPPHRLEPGPQP